MATLDKMFLDDLADLDNDFEMDATTEENNDSKNTTDKDINQTNSISLFSNDVNSMIKAVKSTQFDDMKHLLQDKNYMSHIESVQKILDDEENHIQTHQLLDTEKEQDKINSSNALLTTISEEILHIHNHIVTLYQSHFPDLSNILRNTMDYIRVVERIGNSTDIMSIDFSDLLSKEQSMTVCVQGSAYIQDTLSEEVLNQVLNLTKEAITLDDHRTILTTYIEKRINFIAPNMCSLVGSRVSALLLGQVGGLKKLAVVPSCNLMVFGQTKETGLNLLVDKKNKGYLYLSDVIQNTPDDYQEKACKILSNKLALAVRADLSGSKDGTLGSEYLNYVNQQIERWQTPTKGHAVKAMKAPDNKPKTRRGGRRINKIKSLYKQSNVSKIRSRVAFNEASGSYGDDAVNDDLGMLAQEGSGLLMVKASNTNFNNAANKRLSKLHISGTTTSSGISTSLIVNPNEGIELITNNPLEMKKKDDKYFSSVSGFASVRPH